MSSSEDFPVVYEGPANFQVSVLKERKSDKRALELSVPGFFRWVMDPERALALGYELHWAATDCMAAAAGKETAAG